MKEYMTRRLHTRDLEGQLLKRPAYRLQTSDMFGVLSWEQYEGDGLHDGRELQYGTVSRPFLRSKTRYYYIVRDKSERFGDSGWHAGIRVIIWPAEPPPKTVQLSKSGNY